MSKSTFDAMAAQYALEEKSGEGIVSWEDGAHCVAPSVVIGGKAIQDGIPTPENPIEPVFSNQTKILSRGRNMFDFVNLAGGEGYTNTVNGVTCTIENGYVVCKGEHTGDSWSNVFTITFPYNKITLPAGTYSLPTYHVPGLIDSLVLWLVERDSTNTRGCRGTFTLEHDARLVSANVGVYGPQTVDLRLPLILVQGTEIPTEYIPYFDGGEAVTPELLAIPGTDYRDEWDAQTGRGVKRVKKLIFDGNEQWDLPSMINNELSFFRLQTKDGVVSSLPMCSHFDCKVDHYNKMSGSVLTCYPAGTIHQLIFAVADDIANSYEQTDTSEWKAYLAEQNAAGTPVTVWYALAEPIPFQTDPQPLIQSKGYCQLIQTDGTLSSCPITAKYVTHS